MTPAELPSVRTGVLGLLASGRPANVSGLVVSIVVDTVNRVIRRRSLSHVPGEGREVTRPLVANADSARAVLEEALRPRVQASLFDADPDVVQARLRKSVRALLYGGSLVARAAARLRRSVHQRVLPSLLDGTAVAFAEGTDKRVRAGWRIDRKDCPSSEAISWRQLRSDLTLLGLIPRDDHGACKTSTGSNATAGHVRSADSLLCSAVTPEHPVSRIKPRNECQHDYRIRYTDQAGNVSNRASDIVSEFSCGEAGKLVQGRLR